MVELSKTLFALAVLMFTVRGVGPYAEQVEGKTW
jgi:hypothetical protein